MIPLAGIINYALISLLCLLVLTASFNFGLSCDLAVCDTKWAEMKMFWCRTSAFKREHLCTIEQSVCVSSIDIRIPLCFSHNTIVKWDVNILC